MVNAVAAKARWGTPVVAVDFGTATTFDVVDETGAYVGGVICPGLVISAEALFARASRLWKVDVRKPKRVLAKNTAEAIQAGLYYGYIGLVDGILERLLDELPTPCAVVATGGQAELIASGIALHPTGRSPLDAHWLAPHLRTQSTQVRPNRDGAA